MKILLTLALFIFTMPAFSQVTILSPTTLPAGTYHRPAAGFVVSQNTAVQAIRMSFQLTAAEQADTTLKFSGGFEFTEDGGQTWEALIQMDYDGSTWLPKNRDASGNPFTTRTVFGPSDYGGQTIRGFLILNSTVNIGATVTCLDINNKVVACQ